MYFYENSTPMKAACLLFLTFWCSSVLLAQVKLAPSTHNNRFRQRNNIHLELGGQGLFYSVNYERNILNYNNFKSSLQLGVSFYPAPIDLRSRLWIPFSVNQLISFNQHHLEAGAGILMTLFQNHSSMEGVLSHDNKMELHPTCKIGYRYQKPGGRMIYKALFTPIMLRELGTYEFIPLGAVSIGYSF